MGAVSMLSTHVDMHGHSLVSTHVDTHGHCQLFCASSVLCSLTNIYLASLPQAGDTAMTLPSSSLQSSGSENENVNKMSSRSV